MSQQNTWIDLTGINFEDVEVLSQEGARAIPEFAASCCQNCSCGTCSCGKEDQIEA
jgi:Thiopeptide-type bacteriocin precursor